MQLKYFVVILALVSISLLYIISLNVQPIEINFEEFEIFEGREVILEGLVGDYSITSYGSQIINLRSLNQTLNVEIPVFIESCSQADYGDIIQATGVIQKYHDSWELVVNSPNNVLVLRSWENCSYPLKILAQNPEKYIGCNIQCTGLIERIYDSFCYILDSSHEYSLAVYFDEYEYQNISEGEVKKFMGRFSYDEQTLRYILDTRVIDNQFFRQE